MRNKIKKALYEPWRIVVWSKMGNVRRIFSDEFYIKCFYRSFFSRKLNLENPDGYNEKLQFLKLNDRKSIYTNMVDKYAAKKYVSEIIGEEYIVKTLGIWEKFDDISFDLLPDKFVLKCTHDSAGIVICKDKKTFDVISARKKLNRCLKKNFYYSGREWPYKNIKPHIIAEEYMEDDILKELRDYKIFTFGGVPRIIHVVSNRQNNGNTYGDFFDMDYNHLNLTMGHENAPVIPEKPVNFELMKRYAELLSKETIHLRVDFYEVNGRLYFGELTFYQDSGVADIKPVEWDKTLGAWIDLSDFR